MNKKKLIIIIVIFLTLIGFFLRVLPFNYGILPIEFNHTNLFGQALTLGKIIAYSNFSQLKIPAMYPYLFSYIFLFFFGILYLAGILTGAFVSSADFIKYSILQMNQLFELSRIILAISGTLLIPLVYIVTRKLIFIKTEHKEKKWAIVGCLLATILITFSLLHVHFAKLLRPHIAVSFFFFITFYFYLILLEKKNLFSYIALGIAAGATAGTLQSGFLSILFLPLAHFFLIYQKIKQKKLINKLKEIFSRQFIAGLIAFMLIVIICYPYLLLSPKASLNIGAGKINLALAGSSHHMSRLSHLTILKENALITQLKFIFLSEPGLIIILLFLLIIYLLFCIGKNINQKERFSHFTIKILGAIIFVVFYFLFFGIFDHARYRTLSALIAFLCTITGVLAVIVLNKIAKKYRFWIIGFIILILIIPITQSFRLTSLATKDSTQELAAKWVNANIPPDEMIAIESHSRLKFLPSQKSLKRRLELAGPNSLGQKNTFLISLEEKDYPQNSRAIFPLFVLENDFNKIYEFLKTEADYLILGRYALEPEANPSIYPVHQISQSLNRELIKRFSPFKKKFSQTVSQFPQEIENPLIDIWTYQRMGPVIEIYKIHH